MVDKNFCANSFLIFRYIVEDGVDFYDDIHHRKYILKSSTILVDDEDDVDNYLQEQLDPLIRKDTGILLSGGMDSACLASYLKGINAYTFRFDNGNYQKEELERAEKYAQINDMKLHYVDINWENVDGVIDKLMDHKGAPIHSIEPQIYLAAKQAQEDGIVNIIIGDAADYKFGGMDKLHAKDWTYEEFKNRYTYLAPDRVLKEPNDLDYVFEKYRQGNYIDYISFMHKYAEIESYASYENAFACAGMEYFDPYENMEMKRPLDLDKIRHGESKYIIRNLFKKRYRGVPIPEKIPMPRMVNAFFANWVGPKRPEFIDDIDIAGFDGNQRWQMYVLERFLNNYESED